MRPFPAAAAICAAAVLLAGCRSADHDTPKATVDSYLTALSAGNGGDIKKIAEPYDRNTKIRAEVDDQLRRYGGKRWTAPSVTLTNGSWAVTDSRCDAVVEAKAKQETYRAVIHLQEQPTGGWLISSIDDDQPAPNSPGCQ
jgi:hypothetical protein